MLLYAWHWLICQAARALLWVVRLVFFRND